MKLIPILALAALGANLAACATVVRGTTTRFEVSSEPPGAEVHASNGFSCQSTPCTFRLSRKDAFDVSVTKPGFEKQTVHVRSHAAGAGVAEMTAGNFLLGGVIGAGVDAASGATNDLEPNPLKVKLVPVAQAEAAKPAETSAATAAPAAAVQPASAPAPAAPAAAPSNP
ncbi:translation initiation factor 2 [Caulobacter sp. KR2-114]|uniref:translation initiation factor 2 n=1 Tax=Caulobacter sp. KR2-114 TaxID=3400912 RepID=UPI003BFCBD06